MQRRAAAVYFVLLVVVGAGAYAFLQVGMAEPEVSVQGPTYGNGDDLTVEGRTYTVGGLSAESEDGETSYSGELTWFNESHRESVTLENGSTTAYRGGEYRVTIANETDVSEFGLVEVQNVSAILADDPEVEDQVAEQDGTEYVFYTNGSRQRLSAYLPEPERLGPFAEGGTIEWPLENETVTADVETVTQESATLSWSAPREETVDLEQGSNVTLAGVDHLVHFESGDGVQVLPTEEYYDDYAQELERVEAFHERKAGFWGVVILSFLGGIVLLSSALMPVRG